MSQARLALAQSRPRPVPRRARASAKRSATGTACTVRASCSTVLCWGRPMRANSPNSAVWWRGEFDGRGKGKAKSVSAILNSRSLCSSGGIGTPTTLLWEGARARPGGCADRSQLPVSMCHSQATHQLREAHAAQHSSQQRSVMHDALRQTVLAETLCEAYVAFSEQRGSPCEHPRRMYAE